MQKEIIWDKVGRLCIYLLFGLVPAFFLPLTGFPISENKAILITVLVLIAFGALLAKILNSGKLSFPKGKFWFALVVFLIIAGISSSLSGSPQLSFWGGVNSPDSFVVFVISALALFLVPVFLRQTGEVIRALLFFSVSLLIVAVYSLLQFFGVFVLPFDFTKQVSFNTIGTVQGLAIFLGSGLVMIVALLTSFKLSQSLKAIFAVAAALLALILILVNFKYVWLGILFASALVVSWQLMHSKRGSGGAHSTSSGQAGQAMLAPKFGLPLVLMVIVAILFFVQPPISAIVELPAEVRPSLSGTLDIAKKTLGGSVTTGLFGSGPSTFLYEYLSHRSTDLNATAFWGVRFVQGFSTIPTLLITMGGLGLISLIAMFALFIASGFKGVASLSRPANQAGKTAGGAEKIALISFVSFLFLLLAWFYYPVNLTIILFTFLFAGMVLASMRIGGAVKDVEISLLQTPQRTFLISLVIIVLIVSVVVGVYWEGQRYISSVLHTQGVSAYNTTQDLDKATKKVSLAVNLDKSQDRYWRTFAQLLGLRAQEVLNNTSLETTGLQQRYQTVLQSQIQAGQQATKVNPRDPQNWRELGKIYENNIVIVSGADRFAIQNYEEAAKRNPQNPTEFLNVARAYVLSADKIQNEITRFGSGSNTNEIEQLQSKRSADLSMALESLQKAINLKSDYAAAHFLASQVYERQGNRKLAIDKTIDTRNLNPLDTGVGYQLGLLYYLDNQIENARIELERVVSLSEAFSNARYFLGLAYDRLDQTQKAIAQFELVGQLNPDNQEVKDILTNLRAGREALASIVPPARPPEERIEPPVPDDGGEEDELLEEVGEFPLEEVDEEEEL